MVLGSYLEVVAENLGYKSVNNLKKAKYKALIKDKAKGFISIARISSCFGLKGDAIYKYKDRVGKRFKVE